MDLPLSTFFTGMGAGLGLIVAIGAQNAFVLRQGLRGQFVFAVCLACALSDAILIAIGVSSFGRLAAMAPGLESLMRYAGAAFLIWYGLKSAHAALFSRSALAAETSTVPQSLLKTLLACLAITWLNPHVYLDTLVLLGTLSSQFGGQERAFAAGAIAGSFLFFFGLGYGAAWLRPIFAKPGAWRILEGSIALVMGGIALRLMLGN